MLDVMQRRGKREQNRGKINTLRKNEKESQGKIHIEVLDVCISDVVLRMVSERN